MLSRIRISAVALICSGVLGIAVPSSGAAEAQPAATGGLQTSILDPATFAGSRRDDAFRRTRAAGATLVRTVLSWSSVAPWGDVRPSGFQPREAGDPLYKWDAFDAQLKAAARSGLSPIVSIVDAPPWAQNGTKDEATDGPVRPSPTHLADFATAAAKRYGGGFRGLPRVRYWQVWNEPNLDIFLTPQFEGGKPVSPELYRAMVNAMARAVHGVRRDNVVLAGGLAPFGGNSNDPSAGTHEEQRVRPLQFMREMLCMSGGRRPKATCNQSTTFDVWSHHPYTYGGPTHSAHHPDDVSLGDLDTMRVLLDAAKKAGHIRSRGAPGFWVTEFSYDSRPGDPKGLEPALHARWVSEALYRMWTDGVTLVTWFLVRDQPFPQEFFQSGLYTANGKPKPALRAFRFPFVAFWKKDGSISYWGRTPTSKKQAIVIEQKAGRWRRVAVPAVNRYGIFMGKIENVKGSGPLRARLASGKDFSQPFSLEVVQDFRFCPWGSFC